MLVTNIATYVLILLLLTVVPMLPGMIMSRYLSTGLAKGRTERAESAVRAMMADRAAVALAVRK